MIDQSLLLIHSFESRAGRTPSHANLASRQTVSVILSHSNIFMHYLVSLERIMSDSNLFIHIFGIARTDYVTLESIPRTDYVTLESIHAFGA